MFVKQGESMKKASLSFLLLALASLFISLQSFAQFSRGASSITEHVNLSLRSERVLISELLRLTFHEQRNLEISALTLTVRNLDLNSSTLELRNRRGLVASEIFRRQTREVRFFLPSRTLIEDLELYTRSEVIIESITAEIAPSFPQSGTHIPGRGHGRSDFPRPTPGHNDSTYQSSSLVTLRVNQLVRGHAVIDLERLARYQGLRLRSEDIEQIVVQGQSSSFSRPASLQVQVNGRSITDVKLLSSGQRAVPFNIRSHEVLRSMELDVNGDAEIFDITIRLGQSGSHRPYPGSSSSQKIIVAQHLSPGRPLDLSRLLGYERRLISAITIDARSIVHLQGQLTLLSAYNESLGSLLVGPHGIRATIHLRRPVMAQELRIEASTSISVDSLEIEFDHHYRYY
jgi:hypothetical protein